MPNQSLFGFPAGALLKVRRTQTSQGQGNSAKVRPAVELRVDNDRRTNDVSLVSYNGTCATPVTDFVIETPTTWSSLGDAFSGALIIGPSPSRKPDKRGGGNTRGIGAICISTGRTAASYVASGLYSIAVGYGSTASGSNATAIGTSASANGTSSTVLGYGATATGSSATATGYNATATGSSATAIGTSAYAAGSNATAIGSSASDGTVTRHARATGDSKVQVYEHFLKRQTTDATPTVVTTNGIAGSTSNQNVLADNTTQSFRGRVVGFISTSDAACAFEFSGLIRRTGSAATTTLVSAVTPVAIGTPDTALATATVAVTADNTNGALAITVTGVAATTINWTCGLTSELRAT